MLAILAGAVHLACKVRQSAHPLRHAAPPWILGDPDVGCATATPSLFHTTS